MIATVNDLRTLFLILAFVSIGLEFRVAPLREAGWRPVGVFAGATAVNLPSASAWRCCCSAGSRLPENEEERSTRAPSGTATGDRCRAAAIRPSDPPERSNHDLPFSPPATPFRRRSPTSCSRHSTSSSRRHRALAPHDEHIELHAELIAAEVAHQLAMARSALHRHPAVRRAELSLLARPIPKARAV